MSDAISKVFDQNSATREDAKRAAAVAAAIELIAARVASPTVKQSQLADEMDNLSRYADQIQQALNKK
ncbi:MAG: hypothetical protein ACN6P2_09745 [Pseudomonas palmensis]|uniref:hypothetical protein n=1 Tax=Pseudomonas palmensis TaxID=2815362 RepID=UPI003D109DFE